MIAGRRYSQLTLVECAVSHLTCELQLPLRFEPAMDQMVMMHKRMHELASGSNNAVVFKVLSFTMFHYFMESGDGERLHKHSRLDQCNWIVM